MTITIDPDSLKQLCLLILSLGILAVIALVVFLHFANIIDERDSKRDSVFDNFKR